MFYCSETYIFLCSEIIWCSYVKQHIIQTYMFCDFFLMFSNLCLCIFVPYSLSIQVSITHLDILHQKHLVEKETYSIMIVQREVIKKKKKKDSSPACPLNLEQFLYFSLALLEPQSQFGTMCPGTEICSRMGIGWKRIKIKGSLPAPLTVTKHLQFSIGVEAWELEF